MAARRFLNDLKRDDLLFYEPSVDRVCRFIALLSHFEGIASGRTFTLQPWQLFVVGNIVGWYVKATKRRRYIYSYIEVARKNGKTFLSAALCLYFLVADGEAGAEVDLAANCREQAAIAFRYCSTLAGQIDSTGRVLKRMRTEVRYMSNNSVLRCFAADSTKLDGFNASFALIDEYHAAINSKVRDVIKSSQGMRRNPHLCTITTAGFSRVSPCYELRQSCVAILRGTATDDATFAAIYSPDDGDDWRSETTWRKANPNLNVTVSTEYLRAQVVSAQNNYGEQVGVKTKNINIWTDTAAVWIDDNKIIERSEAVERHGERLYVGVDLAAVGDLTCVSYLYQQADMTLRMWTDYYVPSAKLTAGGRYEQQYQQWARQGYVNVTDGNVTDYDRITADIIKYNEQGNTIAMVSYDQWNATQWAIDCTSRGLPLRPYSQTTGSFNKPTRELERRIMGGGLTIDYNPVTLHCFANVKIKVDVNGNIKPSKDDYETKIDGVISMCMALGGYLTEPQTAPSIFVI
jgi:phage terminase large subunit-like protein